MLDIEKSFRELATALQLGRGTWADVSSTFRIAEEMLERVREQAKRILEDPYAERDDRAAAAAILSIVDTVRESIDRLRKEMYTCMKMGLDPRSCRVDYTPIYRLEQEVMKHVGKACAFKVSDMFTSALNDLAACVHRVAESAMRSFEWRREGKCYFAPSATPEARLLCRMWDLATEVLAENQMYHPEDVRALLGYAVGDKVYLAVGSAEGHRTEVDLEKGTLNYYDEDRKVNELVAERLARAGLACEIHDFGVTCSGVKKDPRQLAEIAAVLAEATSADFRITYGYKSLRFDLVAKHLEKLKDFQTRH